MLSIPESEDQRAVRIDTVRLGDGEIFIAGSTGPPNRQNDASQP